MGKEHTRLWQRLQQYHLQDSFLVDAYYAETSRYSDRVESLEDAVEVYERMRAPSYYNMIKRVVDTALTMFVDTPTITLQTDNAPWKIQRIARDLNKIINAELRNCGFVDRALMLAKDGCLTRKGCVHIYWDSEREKIASRRVLAHDLIWNEAEGKEPRRMGIRYGISASRKEVRHIKDPPRYEPSSLSGHYRASWSDEGHLVEITEEWDLNEHTHVIFCGDEVVQKNKWTPDFFPLVTWGWEDSHDSFASVPLAERVLPFQLGINKYLGMIERGIDANCRIRVFHSPLGKMDPERMRDRGDVVMIPVSGPPPVISQGSGVSADVLRHLEDVIRNAHEFNGVSYQAATGDQPKGLESGKAIRTYHDTMASRQRLVSESFAQCFCKAARILTYLADENYGDIRKMDARSALAESIDFKRFDLESNGLDIQVELTSALAKHPSHRLDDVADMLKAGLLKDNAHALKLLGIPDTESYAEEMNAGRDLAEYQIEEAMDGKVLTPDKTQDLDALATMARARLWSSLKRGASEGDMKGLHRFIALVDQMLIKAKPAKELPPPAPMPPAPGGSLPPVGAEPMPPPMPMQGQPMPMQGQPMPMPI